jgi:hypothetical protein
VNCMTNQRVAGLLALCGCLSDRWSPAPTTALTMGSAIMSDPGAFTSPEVTEMTTGETTKSATQEATETVLPESASPPNTATTPEAP